MSSSFFHTWPRRVFLVGAIYFVVGRASTWPTANVHAWRLAAWCVSGVIFFLHVFRESTRLRTSAISTAFHASLAVAFGAFLLAVAGLLHALRTQPTVQPNWMLALVAWPAFTAIPAFLAAFLAVTLRSLHERSTLH